MYVHKAERDSCRITSQLCFSRDLRVNALARAAKALVIMRMDKIQTCDIQPARIAFILIFRLFFAELARLG